MGDAGPEGLDAGRESSLADGALVGSELVRLVRVLTAWRQRARDEAQWGLGDRMLLGRLVDFGEQRATDLAAKCFLDLSTVSRQIGSLVTRDLVARRPDPDDRRGTLLAATEAGRAQVRRYRAERDRAMAGVLAPWPPEERAQLVRLLARLNDGLCDQYARLAEGMGPAPVPALAVTPTEARREARNETEGR
jgi:DNA-binding MarR family transcriptional regulator